VIDAPSVRRVLVGAALRRYRENLGLLLEDAAHLLDCDRSKISRIETGQRGIRPKELRELLTEYGVGEDEQAVLAGITQAGRGTGPQPYGQALPGAFREYLALEQAASDLFAYDPQHVPELLQTPGYAQARMAGDPAGRAEGGAGVLAGLLLARQHALGERRCRLTVVIGEAALRQDTGGGQVTRDQLRALASGSGRAVVQVLPAGYEAPASGPVTIVRFAEVPSLGAVYLPGLSGGVCLVGPQEVAAYTRAFEQLRAAALTPGASGRLLRELAGG
jgi:transcriptional regulator with XRE-family HTH domain